MDFQVFILKPRRFSSRIRQEFGIFHSKFFGRAVTYNPNIVFLRRAVAKVVCFGDLFFTPEYQVKCERLLARSR